MRIIFCFIAAVVLVVSCGKDEEKNQYSTQVCGTFSRINPETMHIVGDNGIPYALQPRNQLIDNLVWSVANGTRGCVFSSDTATAQAGWFPNGATATLIYVDSTTTM